MACCGSKTISNKTKPVYLPKFKSEALTEKFYSQYNTSVADQLVNEAKVKEYEEKIEQYRKYDARCAYKLPRYTNQTYGWLPGYKIRFLQNCDLRICSHPAILNAIKNLWKQSTSQDKKPLPSYSHCACNRFQRKRT